MHRIAIALLLLLSAVPLSADGISYRDEPLSAWLGRSGKVAALGTVLEVPRDGTRLVVRVDALVTNQSRPRYAGEGPVLATGTTRAMRVVGGPVFHPRKWVLYERYWAAQEPQTFKAGDRVVALPDHGGERWVFAPWTDARERALRLLCAADRVARLAAAKREALLDLMGNYDAFDVAYVEAAARVARGHLDRAFLDRGAILAAQGSGQVEPLERHRQALVEAKVGIKRFDELYAACLRVLPAPAADEASPAYRQSIERFLVDPVTRFLRLRTVHYLKETGWLTGVLFYHECRARGRLATDLRVELGNALLDRVAELSGAEARNPLLRSALVDWLVRRPSWKRSDERVAPWLARLGTDGRRAVAFDLVPHLGAGMHLDDGTDPLLLSIVLGALKEGAADKAYHAPALLGAFVDHAARVPGGASAAREILRALVAAAWPDKTKVKALATVYLQRWPGVLDAELRGKLER